MKKEAPLHNDCLQLARWVATTIDPTLPTGRRAHELAIELVEQVALALHGYDREESVENADRAAARLRVVLRLCLEVGLVSDGGLLHTAEQLDRIGRQIGGWQRHLAEGRG